MDFTFVHAADLHLDTPFVGLSQLPPPLRERIHESTFQAYDELIQFCIDERVDFLVLSGDIFNSADRSLRAQLRFRDGLARLSSQGISSYVIHGNHDPLDGYRARLDWPEGVHIFEGDRVESVPFMKAGREQARIYGISYATSHVQENLAPLFRRETHDVFAIGILHTNVGSVSAHGNYAPCSIEDLNKAGMDYWALGHIHARNVLKQANPVIVYPGNTQGRSFKETGEKGCYLVRVENGLPSLHFKPLDKVRWFDLRIDASGCHTEQQLISLLDEHMNDCMQHAGGGSVITRVTLVENEWLSSVLKKQSVMEDLLLRYREVSEPFLWTQSIGVVSPQLHIEDPFLLEMADWVNRLKQDSSLARELLQDAQAPLVLEHRLGSKWLTGINASEKEWVREFERMLSATDKGGNWK
ncbi:DNA repair exonuclease [Ammoniphilus sp. YIM 78166]|uniref:metallophosphoesterase family protein n=1 Tax=Ammoniphilus sp. YIM 78166 TaxID=1644106 RepID=UPI0014318F65|nr:DNA repair exonuclease [Ammoniphilus sp. YIM 78166]